MLRGMDSERVAALAAQLNLQAEALGAIVAVVDDSVRALADIWFGENLSTFHSAWVGQQRAQAHAAAADIAAAVQQLREQIGQQLAASGTSSDGTSGSHHGAGEVVGGILAEAALAAHSANWLAQGASHLGENRFSMGRYPKAWNGLMDRVHAFGTAHGVGSLEHTLRFKQWPLLHFLNRHEGFIGKVEHGTGHLAAGLGIASAGVDVVDDLKHHDVRNAVFDGLSGGTNLIKKSLAGWTAGIWVEAGRAATNSQIDYSWNGLQDIVTASPKEWAHAIVEGIQSPEGTKAVNNITFGLPNLLAKWAE